MTLRHISQAPRILVHLSRPGFHDDIRRYMGLLIDKDGVSITCLYDWITTH